jgi:hypothetical protein
MAILKSHINFPLSRHDQTLPLINIIQNAICPSPPMGNNEVFFHPSYEVILKGPFNDLMEEIRSDELMYIGSWEVICEGLNLVRYYGKRYGSGKSYYHISDNSIFTPQSRNFICVYQSFCQFSGAWALIAVFIIQIIV